MKHNYRQQIMEKFGHIVFVLFLAATGIKCSAETASTNKQVSAVMEIAEQLNIENTRFAAFKNQRYCIIISENVYAQRYDIYHLHKKLLKDGRLIDVTDTLSVPFGNIAIDKLMRITDSQNGNTNGPRDFNNSEDEDIITECLDDEVPAVEPEYYLSSNRKSGRIVVFNTSDVFKPSESDFPTQVFNWIKLPSLFHKPD